MRKPQRGSCPPMTRKLSPSESLCENREVYRGFAFQRVAKAESLCEIQGFCRRAQLLQRVSERLNSLQRVSEGYGVQRVAKAESLCGAQVTIVDDETLQWTAGYPWTPEVEAFFRTHAPIVRHILASIPTTCPRWSCERRSGEPSGSGWTFRWRRASQVKRSLKMPDLVITAHHRFPPAGIQPSS